MNSFFLSLLFIKKIGENKKLFDLCTRTVYFICTSSLMHTMTKLLKICLQGSVSLTDCLYVLVVDWPEFICLSIILKNILIYVILRRVIISDSIMGCIRFVFAFVIPTNGQTKLQNILVIVVINLVREINFKTKILKH